MHLKSMIATKLTACVRKDGVKKKFEVNAREMFEFESDTVKEDR